MATYFYYTISLASPTAELLPPIAKALRDLPFEYFEADEPARRDDGAIEVAIIGDGYMWPDLVNDLMRDASARGVHIKVFAHSTDGDSIARLFDFDQGKGSLVYSGGYVNGMEVAETLAAAEAGDKEARAELAALFAGASDTDCFEDMAEACTWAAFIDEHDISPQPHQIKGWLAQLDAIRKSIAQEDIDPFEDDGETLERIQSKAQSVGLSDRAKGKGKTGDGRGTV